MTTEFREYEVDMNQPISLTHSSIEWLRLASDLMRAFDKYSTEFPEFIIVAEDIVREVAAQGGTLKFKEKR